MLTKKDIQNNVAANFKYARKLMGLTQHEMAEDVKINFKSYQKIEEAGSVTYMNVYKLSRIINVSMHDIFLTDISKL